MRVTKFGITKSQSASSDSSLPFHCSPMSSVNEEAILDGYTPQVPIKRIFSDQDIEPFTQTEAFARIIDFVKLLNTSVLNKKISDQCLESQVRIFTSWLTPRQCLPYRHSFRRMWKRCLNCLTSFQTGLTIFHQQPMRKGLVTKRFVFGWTKLKRLATFQRTIYALYSRSLTIWPVI